MAKKDALKMAEQLVIAVEKIRQRAASGIFSNMPAATSLFLNPAEPFVENHQSSQEPA